MRGDWEHRFQSGWRSSWVAKTMEYFVGQGVNIGSGGNRLVPNAGQQLRDLREVHQRAWEEQDRWESTFKRFYRQITPRWGVDRSVSVPDKKLRIVLARFRAGCYLLNSGPRHGYQLCFAAGATRACPCCRRESETMAHFFFHCPAYQQERVRFGINHFWGTGSIQTSLVRLFQDRRSRPERLARFIAFAWKVRDRYLRGDDLLQLWE